MTIGETDNYAVLDQVVRARVDAMLELSGQPGPLEVRTRPLQRLTGIATPAAYFPFRGALDFDLDRFWTGGNPEVAPPSPGDLSPLHVAMIDGVVLHELGHRRDRKLLLVRRGMLMVPLGVFTVASVLTAFVQQTVLMWAMLLAIPAALVGVLVFTMTAHWTEFRADRYLATVGGALRVGAFAMLLGDVGRNRTHPSAAARRQRMERVLGTSLDQESTLALLAAAD